MESVLSGREARDIISDLAVLAWILLKVHNSRNRLACLLPAMARLTIGTNDTSSTH